MRVATSLVLLLGGCAYTTRTVVLVDPVLLAPSSRPIPEGLVPTNLERVEIRACGAEYQGLDNLIARAQIDRDALIQVTVDLEHHYTFRGAGTGGVIRGEPYLTDETRCYVLRAFRTTFRAPP